MIETTITDPEKHETVTADSQGRISLGVEYAARDVEIVVVDSEVHESEESGIQQTIGAEPMTEHERLGMSFVRSFGVRSEFLKDDHTAAVGDDGVDPETVAPTDVDWSQGYLGDPKNAVRLEFDERGQERGFPFAETLTEEPASVTADEVASEAVYSFTNEAGDRSAILAEYVEHVQQLFGYDPAKDSAHVRVNPDDGPNPVLFRDPDSDVYVGIAPWVDE